MLQAQGVGQLAAELVTVTVTRNFGLKFRPDTYRLQESSKGPVLTEVFEIDKRWVLSGPVRCSGRN